MNSGEAAIELDAKAIFKMIDINKRKRQNIYKYLYIFLYAGKYVESCILVGTVSGFNKYFFFEFFLLLFHIFNFPLEYLSN